MKKLSRSKLELFLNCPRCFWFDMNKGLKRPPPAPYTINSSIDYLLKREFDAHRQEGSRHYLMERYKIDAIPYKCPQIDEWRNNFTGIRTEHRESGFLVFGAVDDVWVNPKGELIVVDYKSTGAQEYRIYESYRRQIEIYQWLLSENGYNVSKKGYFVFAKVDKNRGFHEGKLSFELFIEPLEGDYTWVPAALKKAALILQGDIPEPESECLYCRFARGASG